MVNNASLRMADSTLLAEYTYPDYIYGAMSSILSSNAHSVNVTWENGTNQYAIFAQEIGDRFSNVVTMVDGVWMVDYEQLIPILWQAIKELANFVNYQP
jgi:hypothetical protein